MGHGVSLLSTGYCTVKSIRLPDMCALTSIFKGEKIYQNRVREGSKISSHKDQGLKRENLELMFNYGKLGLILVGVCHLFVYMSLSLLGPSLFILKSCMDAHL